MTSDAKITLHKLHAAYAKRFAEQNQVSVKAVIEGLIEDHLIDDMLGADCSSLSWADLEIAANRLLPSDWSLSTLNAASGASAPAKLFHMISFGGIGPIFASSDALNTFSEGIAEVARHGSSVCLDSALKVGSAGVQVRRRGNGLVFIDYADVADPEHVGPITFPSRHVDKLNRAFKLAIQSCALKGGHHHDA